MTLSGGIIYVLFVAGPYVITVIALLVAVAVAVYLIFRRSRRFGYVALCAVVSVSGLLGFIYMIKAPNDFNAACASGTGVKVLDNIKADSYALSYTPNFGEGYLNMTDATFKQAILNVANKRIRFVELPDSNERAYQYNHLARSLAKYRKSSDKSGYFKVFVAQRGVEQCRWLMPEDVKPLTYTVYLKRGLNDEPNQKLKNNTGGKECVAVEYVASETSPYIVEFFLGKKIGSNLLKHEIRIVDRLRDNAIIGNATAYQYKSDGVYSSVAFWLGNGMRHRRCPVDLLEGNIVRDILHI